LLVIMFHPRWRASVLSREMSMQSVNRMASERKQKK
jgi:hypothetical protein